MQKISVDIKNEFDKSIFYNAPQSIPAFLRDPEVFETLWNCQSHEKRIVSVYEEGKLMGFFPLYHLYHSLEKFDEAQQKNYKSIISDGYWTMLGADILPYRYLFTGELNKIAEVLPPSICIYEVPKEYAGMTGVFPCDETSVIKLPLTVEEYIKSLSKKHRLERKNLYNKNKDLQLIMNKYEDTEEAIMNLWLPYWKKRGSNRGNKEWAKTLVSVYKKLIEKDYMRTMSIYKGCNMIGMNFHIIDKDTLYDLCFARKESDELIRRSLGIFDIYVMIEKAIENRVRHYDLLDSSLHYKSRFNPNVVQNYAFSVVKEGEDKIFPYAKIVSKFDYKYFDDRNWDGGLKGYEEQGQGYGGDYSSWKKEAYILNEAFNPKSFLDVGCAKGFLVAEMAKLGIESYGIDISDYAVSCAVKDATIMKGSVTDIPFKRRFDLVNCCSVVQYLEGDEVRLAINELCRVADRYIVFYSRPNAIGMSGKEDDYYGKTFKPKEYWQDIFQEYGFRLIYEKDNELYFKKGNKLNQCIRCGWCCIINSAEGKEIKQEELAEYMTCDKDCVNYKRDNNIKFRCPNLIGDNVCKIYENRYECCRLYPLPIDIEQGKIGINFFGGCGYV